MTAQLLDYRSITPGLEPECEVLVDGHWYPGFVRGWYRYPDGWSASVQYSVEPASNYLATFPPEHFRKVNSPVDDAPKKPETF